MIKKKKQTFRKIANSLNIDEKEVEFAYNAYWKFFRTQIESVPIDSTMSEEDFNNNTRSISIYGIGKMYIPYYRYIQKCKKWEKKYEDKECETDVQYGIDNGE